MTDTFESAPQHRKTGMLCACGKKLVVTDTTATDQGSTVVRLRKCPDPTCGLRFISWEHRVLASPNTPTRIRNNKRYVK